MVSPLLGGTVSYVTFHYIKKYVLLYNEAATARLKAIRAEKKAHKKAHKKAFERLSEVEQVAYAVAMTRDAEARMDDEPPDDLETPYYQQLYRIEQKRDEIEAFRALQLYVPVIAAAGTMTIVAMLIFKGLKHMHLGLSPINSYLIVMMAGAAVWMAIYIFTRTLRGQSLARSTFLVFSRMQVFTASGFAFSHGSNDIANAIGPFAAILDVLRHGAVGSTAEVQPLVMLTFGIALIAGLGSSARRSWLPWAPISPKCIRHRGSWRNCPRRGW